MDYAQTLNLPKTNFPMRGNLPEREPEILNYWKEIDLYNKIVENSKDKDVFIFHDGPPYANGHIHIGTALNKVLKDIVIKYKIIKGYFVPYTPGWDTHGLPIELKALELLKGKRDPLEIRKACKNYALKFQKIQCKEFKRLGVLGDYDNPYLTLKPEYEATEIEVFKKLVEKGYIYRNLKPIYWCPHCVTALAEAEIEYENHTSPSIYVKFKLKEEFKGLKPENTHIVIWTTTPWTLPANVAICLHPNFDYVAFEYNDENYIVAEGLYNAFLNALNWEPVISKILFKFKGKELENILTEHPFIENRLSKIILGEHVTLDTGTGCVHTAPGHGVEDYQVGLKYNLPIISPVDEKGCFTDEFSILKGEYVENTNKDIINILKDKNALISESKIKHSYPHCWRCKKPVIFRATPQWFIKVEDSDLRKKSLSECDKINWIPEYGYHRITSMLENRPDWCISRQRVWGVPIPAIYCKKCKKPILNTQIIQNVADVFRKEGSDSWFIKNIKEFLPSNFKCPHCNGKEFEKEMDILDVWFDSGVSHKAVLENWPHLKWPADLYLEGSDQHRGWFQTSLLTSVGAFNKAPYKTVLTHGFVVDGEGKKMSKSLGNVISPEEIIKKYGADILRLWVASSDYQEDIRISKQILSQMADAYRKIRNTARFILGNLYDFEYEKECIKFDNREELDKYIIYRLKKLIANVEKAYENYEFYRLYHQINNFCTIDLSSFYLDIIKDRLYTLKAKDKKRLSAQSTMYEILMSITLMISPILTFTAEEIYSYIPSKKKESIYLENWPSINYDIDQNIVDKFDFLLKIKEVVGKALENARREKIIGHSLDAKISLFFEKNKEFLKENKELIREILIVSDFEVLETPLSDNIGIYWDEDKKFQIFIEKASGKKCPRCWQYHKLTEKGICERCKNVLE